MGGDEGAARPIACLPLWCEQRRVLVKENRRRIVVIYLHKEGYVRTNHQRRSSRVVPPQRQHNNKRRRRRVNRQPPAKKDQPPAGWPAGWLGVVVLRRAGVIVRRRRPTTPIVNKLGVVVLNIRMMEQKRQLHLLLFCPLFHICRRPQQHGRASSCSRLLVVVAIISSHQPTRACSLRSAARPPPRRAR